MPPKSRKIPHYLRCFHCGRDREISKYEGSAPRDCDPSLYRHTQDASMPFHSIACTCGHYTSYGYDVFEDQGWGLNQSKDKTKKA